MNDNNVVVYVEKLVDLQKKIESGGSKLVELLNKMKNETAKMNDIYDSPTAIVFREKQMEYLDDRINYITENYLGLINILDNIIAVYNGTESNIDNMVGGS